MAHDEPAGEKAIADMSFSTKRKTATSAPVGDCKKHTEDVILKQAARISSLEAELASRPNCDSVNGPVCAMMGNQVNVSRALEAKLGRVMEALDKCATEFDVRAGKPIDSPTRPVDWADHGERMAYLRAAAFIRRLAAQEDTQ